MDTVRCRGCTCTRSCTVALRPPPNKYGCTKVQSTTTFVVVLPYFRACVSCLYFRALLYGSTEIDTFVRKYYFRTSFVLSYKVPSYVRVHVLYCTFIPHEGKILISLICVSLWTAGLNFGRARRTIRHAEPLHSPRYPVFVSLTQDVSFSSDDFSCVDCHAHCCRPHNSGSHGFPRQPA
jgi:hypothetical protein